jgi:signal transduction histidine kinase
MENSSQCSNCQSIIIENAVFCPQCGYPENGTEQDISKYNYSLKIKKDLVEDSKKKMKNVKILLYVIAGINVVVGLFLLMDSVTFVDGISSFVAAAVFIGCAIWVNNQPLTGVIAAFVFWLLLQLSVIFIDPAMLFQGIILKVIFIGIFIKGILSANDAKKYTAQLKEMKAI